MAVQRIALGEGIVGGTGIHLRLLATLGRYAIAYGFASPGNDVNAQIRNGPTCVRVAVFSTIQGEAKHFLHAAMLLRMAIIHSGRTCLNLVPSCDHLRWVGAWLLSDANAIRRRSRFGL
jgi:hypothetical protein